MKFGLRTPSLKKRFAARTSVKRVIRSKIRMPRGTGFITNPQRAVYNAVYHRTSVSADRVVRPPKTTPSTKSNTSWTTWLILFLLLPFIGPFLLVYFVYKIWLSRRSTMDSNTKR